MEESRPNESALLQDLWLGVDSFDEYEWVKLLLRRCGTQRWDPHIDWIVQSRTFSGKQAGEILREWQQYRAAMMAWMSRYDALICPVYAKASLPSGFDFDEETLRGFSYTYAYNYTGWPAAVVRGGTSADGMPIGVQVVSHPWCEDICLAVAKYLETALGGWQKPAFD